LLATSGSNGNRGWRVEKDSPFVADQEQLEAEHPRLHEVFAVVERLLQAIPTLNASRIDDEKWVYKTRSALGAPSLVLFYEILDTENLVRLLAAVVA
jgi:hypothetical protein